MNTIRTALWSTLPSTDNERYTHLVYCVEVSVLFSPHGQLEETRETGQGQMRSKTHTDTLSFNQWFKGQRP
jgi:hypothetical protein